MRDADQSLMERFQRGDESAFEALVRQYQGMVLSLCRRYLGSRYGEVEDVAQQVFLRLYRGRMGWEPKAKVKTWIYTIAVNACLNEIRRVRSSKNRRVAAFTAVFGDDPDDAPALADRAASEPGDRLGEGEIAARVRRAVDSLPEQQRLAVVLSRFHHCSYEEVAASMGTTVPAVKSLMTRARENLRAALSDVVAAPGEEAPGAASEPAGRGKPPPLGRGSREHGA